MTQGPRTQVPKDTGTQPHSVTEERPGHPRGYKGPTSPECLEVFQIVCFGGVGLGGCKYGARQRSYVGLMGLPKGLGAQGPWGSGA
jgi:hypothetical protein